MRFVLGLGFSLLCCAFYCATAQAEVGKASASPGEWFLGFNIGGVASWGPDKQAYSILYLNEASFEGEVLLDDGAFYFGGIEVGHVFDNPSLPLERVELNLDFRKMTRSLHKSPDVASLIVIESNFTGGGFSIEDPALTAEDDESDVEARLMTLLASDLQV